MADALAGNQGTLLLRLRRFFRFPFRRRVDLAGRPGGTIGRRRQVPVEFSVQGRGSPGEGPFTRPPGGRRQAGQGLIQAAAVRPSQRVDLPPERLAESFPGRPQ